MKKIALDIIALSHSVTQSSNYAVVLGEKEGNRKLPIVIGSFEAQAIAVALEHMTPNRPLTHDLFKNVMETFDVTILEVLINDLIDGIFHAKLICEKENDVYEIDSRTSDALALAVRFGCPVNTYDFILDSAGVVLEGESEVQEIQEPTETQADNLERLNKEDLQSQLKEALDNENYEEAAKIRDELKRREES